MEEERNLILERGSWLLEWGNPSKIVDSRWANLEKEKQTPKATAGNA